MNELEQHCQKWIEKSNNYDETNTEEVFDKFFTLFVTYNSIYLNATRHLIRNGKISKKRTGEKVSATNNMTDFIGTENLYNMLIELKTEVIKIIEEAEDDRFYISTKKYTFEPDSETDAKLVNDIKNKFESTNKIEQKKFNIALLTLIYSVRCNMFHGQKRLLSQQKKILNPMNKILKTIITNLINQKKLNFS